MDRTEPLSLTASDNVSSAMSSIYPVILSGGTGSRLWPVSRSQMPKQLMPFLSEKSLLQETALRLWGLDGIAPPLVISNSDHRFMSAAQLHELGIETTAHVLEPVGRNTAAAAAVAAKIVGDLDANGILLLVPADHHIMDVEGFRKAVLAGADLARAGHIVTFGITAKSPETGYGYIHLGKAAGSEFPGLRRVRRFVEKPGAVTARRYLRSPEYRWNAGIFVWKARSVLEEIAVCAPDLHRALAPLRRSAKRRAQIEESYSRAPSLPIDVAVMERSKRVWSLPADFAWSDVGTWQSLAAELGVGTPSSRRGRKGAEEGSSRVISGDVLQSGSDRNLVWGSERLIALVGVEDLAVIDTGDVILVAKLDRSADVRKLVARLHEGGRSDLT